MKTEDRLNDFGKPLHVAGPKRAVDGQLRHSRISDNELLAVVAIKLVDSIL